MPEFCRMCGLWRMVRSRMGRDVRLLAVAVTIGLVVAGGMAVTYWPSMHSDPVVYDSAQQRTIHAPGKADTEISQHFEQGVAWLNARDYENALRAFHSVLKLSPEMPEAHVNAGFALMGLKRYAAARDFFEGAVALRKNQINAYYGLALAASGVNDLQGANDAMSVYLHLSPANDLYRVKAQAAIEQWQARLKRPGQMRRPASGVK